MKDSERAFHPPQLLRVGFETDDNTMEFPDARHNLRACIRNYTRLFRILDETYRNYAKKQDIFSRFPRASDTLRSGKYGIV